MKIHLLTHFRVSILLACILIHGGSDAPSVLHAQSSDAKRVHQVAPFRWLGRTYYQRGVEVLWRADFSKFEEGKLPQNFEVERGQVDVRRIEGRTFLSTVEGAVVVLVLDQVLPDRFSLEIEYQSREASDPFLFDCADRGSEKDTCLFGSLGNRSFVQRKEIRSEVDAELPKGGLIHPRFTFDGDHVTGYLNEQLLPALPDCKLQRSKRVRMRIPAGSNINPTLISVINIAKGGKGYRILDTP